MPNQENERIARITGRYGFWGAVVAAIITCSVMVFIKFYPTEQSNGKEFPESLPEKNQVTDLEEGKRPGSKNGQKGTTPKVKDRDSVAQEQSQERFDADTEKDTRLPSSEDTKSVSNLQYVHYKNKYWPKCSIGKKWDGERCVGKSEYKPFRAAKNLCRSMGCGILSAKHINSICRCPSRFMSSKTSVNCDCVEIAETRSIFSYEKGKYWMDFGNDSWVFSSDEGTVRTKMPGVKNIKTKCVCDQSPIK